MKKAVITGHSKGLGKALAMSLIEQGFDILGLSRSTCEDENGLQQVSLDLSDPAALLQWVDSGVLAQFLDGADQAILINNSGIIGPVNPPGRQDNRGIITSVDLNVTAPLVLTNVFINNTEHAADRRILHISSGAGRTTMAGWSVYCATKAALDHHARVVGEENIANLRITSLAPGIIDTGMQADIRSTPVDAFPELDTFRGLKTGGHLQSATDTANAVARILLAPEFGSEQLTDIRDFGNIN